MQKVFIKTYNVETFNILIQTSQMKVCMVVKDVLCLLFFKNEINNFAYLLCIYKCC